MTATRRSLRISLPQLALLILLVGLFLFGAASGYLKGQWSWQKPPEVAQLKQLGNLQNRGIELADWTVVEQIDQFPVGGHTWIAKQLAPATGSGLPPEFRPWVLMRSQLASSDLPQVDWVDIQGRFQWKEDDVRRIEFTTPADPTASAARPPSAPPTSRVEARFVRGWQIGGAYAALEWYAWPGGGSPEPGDWFWRDRSAQLKNQRVPWVATAVLIPLPKGADIDVVQPAAETLGGQIQDEIEETLAIATPTPAKPPA